LSQIDEKTNRMINMVKCGSKGKETNVAQIVACVGQQNVDGKRIGYGFTDRTLPHFTKYDDGPDARGFVENSFIDGLSPQEVFFHAMGGREGLIDTAVKTSETGYIQRRLVKAMEDVKVYYDNTVRNAKGSIIQYIYGEDGMDGCKIESQYIPFIEMNSMDMEQKYNLTQNDRLNNYMIAKAYKEVNQ
jgi:DNA-directed RNA polymerase II subunit RPB1